MPTPRYPPTPSPFPPQWYVNLRRSLLAPFPPRAGIARWPDKSPHDTYDGAIAALQMSVAPDGREIYPL